MVDKPRLHYNPYTRGYDNAKGQEVVSGLEFAWIGGGGGWRMIHDSGDKEQIAIAHEIVNRAKQGGNDGR